MPDRAVPLLPPVLLTTPDMTKPELYAVPVEATMTVVDVTGVGVATAPEATMLEPPPVPPALPEIMYPEL